MSIINKPTIVPRWATTGSKIEPTSGKKDLGWLPGEKPPAEYENWLQHYSMLWNEYEDKISNFQQYNDTVEREQVSQLRTDADFVTGNNIDGEINGVVITTVPFNTDHATTMADLATEIQSNPDISSAIVDPEDDRKINIIGNGVAVTFSGFVVTGGASQPGINFVDLFSFLIGSFNLKSALKGPGSSIFENVDRIIRIRNQVEFEYYFGRFYGDTEAAWYIKELPEFGAGFPGVRIPANTIIYLSPIEGPVGDGTTPGEGVTGAHTWNGKPGYILRNAVDCSEGNFAIIGTGNDQVNIIRSEQAGSSRYLVKFHNFPTERQETTLAPTGSAFNGVPDTSGFEVGNYVYWQLDRQYYKVIAKTGSTITVDRDISGTSGTSVLNKTTENVLMTGFSYDGRGLVNGFGGIVSVFPNERGGAFKISTINNWKINARIINFKIGDGTAAYGAAICGYALDGNTIAGTTKSFSFSAGMRALIAENISDCELAGSATSFGIVTSGIYSKINIQNCKMAGNGAIYRFSNSEIIGRNCVSSAGTGGLGLNVDKSIINAFQCQGVQGGAVDFGSFSKITARECSATGSGGAVSRSLGFELEAYDCTAAVNGGAVFQCQQSKIFAYNCTAGADGGAIYQSSDNFLMAFQCQATVNGGAAALSNRCKIIADGCSCNGTGGAANECDEINLEAYNCDADGNGGAAFGCDNSNLYASDCETNTQDGGGFHSCDNCEILVVDCASVVGSGGGCYECEGSTIKAVSCTAAVNGGGAALCNNSYINARNCSAGDSGGGSYNSINFIAFGSWVGNSATSGPNIFASGGAANGWAGFFHIQGDSSPTNQTSFTAAEV